MLYTKQPAHWEVVIHKLNSTMSDLYESTRSFRSEEKALEYARSIKHPERVLKIREVSDYTPAPQREVW